MTSNPTVPALPPRGFTSAHPLTLIAVIVIVVLVLRPDAAVGATCGAVLLAVSEAYRRLSR
jgi:hypothetical protein